ncbi:hypothetical protein MARCHEWKA_03930 [Brevundimonas phage vB_BpoS-Marchewka]|uniref:Uncharacterized protein n=1 Tax=Brevundimonas phage vB_BpoS-Marchewka TaxID=2948604 RepID=A0A9E7N4H5_9CAUD|nr:hypothetical protein MARCHEWKA_03930 [Brevundimonas phage vB_BpoS-Marchewka]
MIAAASVAKTDIGVSVNIYLSLLLGGLVSLGVYYGGYHSGKFHRGWREAQAKKAEDAARDEAARLKFERQYARHKEVEPLWEAYDERKVAAFAAFEAECLHPTYIIRMATGADYPNFYVLKREIRAPFVSRGHDYVMDQYGNNHYLCTEAPPQEDPKFEVHYARVETRLSFPTAPDAERWLAACLKPEDTAWGYTATGRPLGAPARALLPTVVV